MLEFLCGVVCGAVIGVIVYFVAKRLVVPGEKGES